MNQIPKEWLTFLREQYPKGSRIELHEMGNDPEPLPSGSTGTLQFIDDAGVFHIAWDNGRKLGVVIGQDRFSVRPPAPTPLKLYMPLTAELYAYDDWGDVENSGIELSGYDLSQYGSTIAVHLLKFRDPEESESGLMHWYVDDDSVSDKVESVFFAAEERNGQLWGVAECLIRGELTAAELDTLKDYIEGQAADGWGESFDQHEIRVDDGELYVHLWNSEDWTIRTEAELFGPEQSPTQTGGPSLG